MASSSSSAPPPTSLPAALQRVSHLEQQLQQIELALQRATGSGIDHLLSSYQLSLSSDPSPTAAAPSESSEPTSSPATKAAEPIDISPYILQALAIRKGIKEGSIDESRHEAAVMELAEGKGLSEEQVQQLRDWAGL
jgi:hypothetical protein